MVWEDISAFTAMFHRFNHGSRASSWGWMMADASWGSEAEARKAEARKPEARKADARKAVSSAYVATVWLREGVMGRSAVYRV